MAPNPGAGWTLPGALKILMPGPPPEIILLLDLGIGFQRTIRAETCWLEPAIMDIFYQYRLHT